MIVKMKKLTLLCTRDSREETLDALRDLGVVHLEHIRAPEGADLDEARGLYDHLKRALEVLPKHPHVKPSGKTPHEVVKAVWELIHRKQALTEQADALDMEIHHYEPFGSFSPETVQELASAGISVKLCKLPVKDTPEFPDDVNVVELSRDRSSIYAALIFRGELNVEVEEIPLPQKSLDALRAELDEVRSRLAATEEEFKTFSGDHDAVAALTGDAEDRVVYLEARSGMGDEADVYYLRGFFPVEQESAIRAAAAKQGWAALMEAPSAGDHVPTLLRNPKWLNPIKPVFQMIGVLPGYKEIDISGLFLLFLSIFFAFLIGDAGYGLLFIAICLFFKFKLRDKPAAKPTLNLLMIMSAFTVLWGVLNGTYFGIRFDLLPAPLRDISSPWLIAGGNEDLARNRVMFICFTIGAIHLTIAHVWNFLRKINSASCLCDLGWLCTTWSLYLIVLNLVLNWVSLTPAIGVVLGIGVVLVALGLILSKELSGLITLVLDVISNFVDIISYVRLYAVGAASLAIAQSFNQMGLDAGHALPPIIGGLIAALIIFFGHALNIVLGAMSVLVHGIRLNTLEFSGHAGVQWGGVAFKPFIKRDDGETVRMELQNNQTAV
jgi:V/A-type H+-transporting ATPase subunit I